MSKATQLGINYRESILERAHRLEVTTEKEYKEEKAKLEVLAKKVQNHEAAYYDSKTETFWKKLRQRVIL
ncbi:hypothetical protein ACSFB8_12325 [Enterococcus faecalis]